MSFSRASDAPPSTVRLYASPGATSFQMMQPVPPSSQRRDAAHQRTCPSAVLPPPVYPEMSGIRSVTSIVGIMR